MNIVWLLRLLLFIYVRLTIIKACLCKKTWKKTKNEVLQSTHYKDFIYETFVNMMDDE